MRAFARISCFLLATAYLCACNRHEAPSTTAASKKAAERPMPVAEETTQLVTVVSNQWNDFRATLRRYERAPGEKWRQVGPSIDAVLGRQGYAWGRGLHGDGAPQGRPGPVKREGDGRSPAGVFEIGTVYGYAATRRDLSLPYVQSGVDLRCVDDPRSPHYNRIVSTTDTEVDWKSAEQMRRDDELYVLAIAIEHNTTAIRRGGGSCIFIHLWEGPDRGMSGCTAISLGALERLARWLAPGAVLVALPMSEYELLKRPWRLPPAAMPSYRRSR